MLAIGGLKRRVCSTANYGDHCEKGLQLRMRYTASSSLNCWEIPSLYNVPAAPVVHGVCLESGLSVQASALGLMLSEWEEGV
jgi:hypothetical protein